MGRIYTTKATDTIDVDLKFDYDRQLCRSRVIKGHFQRLNEAYKDSQQHCEEPLDVEFAMVLSMKHDEKDVTKKVWVPLTTVYDGVNGLRLFMKRKVIEFVYTYAGSACEIQTMQLSRLYVISENNR